MRERNSMDINAYEQEIKTTEDTDRLREIMDEVRVIRNDLLNKFRDEESKAEREVLHAQLYTCKTLTHQAKSKIMAIAHRKITKPSFMR